MSWEEFLNELNCIDNQKERYRRALDLCKAARKHACSNVKDELSSRQITKLFAAERMGIDPGGFGRQLKGNFAIPPEALLKLCYNLLNKSVTQIMFDDKGKTRLPRALSAALSPLEDEDNATRGRIVKYAQSLRTEAVRSQHLAPEVPLNVLLRSRINEIAEDRDVLPIHICGERAEPAVCASIRNLFGKDDFCCTLNSLLYIAACNRTTIDALIAPNPVTYTAICFYKSTGEKTVYNKNIRKLAGIYYELDEEYRRRLLVYSMNRHWVQSAAASGS